MSLSKNIVADFVKATKNDKKDNKEKFVYGTIVQEDGQYYVKIDGATTKTPISNFPTTIDVEKKVIVMIKNHSAVITGNVMTADESSNHIPKKINALNTVARESQIRALWDE